MRLVVAGEEGGGLGDVAPFGKAFTPPFVVFGDWVILGQIEGDRFQLR